MCICVSMGRFYGATMKLDPYPVTKRPAGIEPVSAAWKAAVIAIIRRSRSAHSYYIILFAVNRAQSPDVTSSYPEPVSGAGFLDCGCSSSPKGIRRGSPHLQMDGPPPRPAATSCHFQGVQQPARGRCTPTQSPARLAPVIALTIRCYTPLPYANEPTHRTLSTLHRVAQNGGSR